MPTLNTVKFDLIMIIRGYAFPLLHLDATGAYLINTPIDVIQAKRQEVLTLSDFSLLQLVTIATSPVNSLSPAPAAWEMDFNDIWDHYFPAFAKPHSHRCLACDHRSSCVNARCQAFPITSDCNAHS